MARHSSEEFERGVEIGFFGLVVSEIIGALMLPLFLLIAAAVFWLTDKFNPGFASAVAQDKSDFLPFLFGAVAIATFVAVWWFRKYEERRRHQEHRDRGQEAEEFDRNRPKKLVQR